MEKREADGERKRRGGWQETIFFRQQLCLFVCLFVDRYLIRSRVLLRAAAEGAAPDVVPQLFDQFGVLLLDLLRKLLSAGKQQRKTVHFYPTGTLSAEITARDLSPVATRGKKKKEEEVV